MLIGEPYDELSCTGPLTYLDKGRGEGGVDLTIVIVYSFILPNTVDYFEVEVSQCHTDV